MGLSSQASTPRLDQSKGSTNKRFVLFQVIYAQTDSVFVHFPSASPAEAVSLGQQVAQLVTAQLPPPIELKYERVMSPFLLLHVNR